MFLIFIAFVTAEPSGYYKKGDIIDIKLPCILNNSYCTNASQCNATIMYPNNTIFYDNQIMTYNKAYHNLTLSRSDIIGEYFSTVVCYDTGNKGSTTFSFLINSSGEKDRENQLLVVYIILITMVIIYIYSSFALGEEHIIPKMVLFFMGFINLIAGLFLAYIDLVAQWNTADMILYMFEGNIFVVIIMVGYFMIYIMRKAGNIDDDVKDL